MHCHKQWNFFSPLVNYVDGMLGKEAQVVLVNLIQLMPAKMDEPISDMRVLINIQIIISVTMSYSQIVPGD